MILQKGSYTREQIIDALHAPQRVIKFRYDLLDKNLRFKCTLKTISTAGISYSAQNSIKRTATFTMRDEAIDYLSARVRPVFCLKMSRGNTWGNVAAKTWGEVATKTWGEIRRTVEWIEWPLGVFILSSPARTADNNVVIRDIEAYDLNQLLHTDAITNRIFFPEGTRYTDAVINLIVGAGHDFYMITQSDEVMPVPMEFEVGKTRLEIINELLAAVNYTPLFVDENGAYIARPDHEPQIGDIAYFYTTKDKSVIFAGATEAVDFFNLPNRFIAFVSNPERPPMVATFENDDVLSQLSTRNRPVVTAVQKVNDMASQAALEEYVTTWARKASIVEANIEFSTALMPMHGYRDIYQFEHEVLRINEVYEEQSWDMSLVAGGTMTHNARRL